MLRHYFRLLGLGFFLGLVLLPAKVQAKPVVHLKVRILTAPLSAKIAAAGGLALEDPVSGERLALFPGPAQLELRRHGERVLLPNGRLCVEVRVVPTGTSGEFVKVGDKPYRGWLEVRASQDTLTVINVVAVEDYVRGVVPLEMAPNWPLEALKAQAVAARTFAYRNLGRHAVDGFDLCATEHCQVYGGVGAETDASNRAVQATAGLVLRFQGELIDAYYHASSGGHTEGAGAVWGTDRPYLTGVEDPWERSPYTEWQVAFTAEKLAALLDKAGLSVGTLEEIKPLERSVTGRVSSFLVRGSEGTRVIPATGLRQALGSTVLKSTWVEVIQPATSAAPPATVLVTVQGANGTFLRSVPAGVRVVDAEGATAVIDPRGGARVGSRGRQSSEIIFRGRGYGHGVGMSQWGAKGMAEADAGSDPEFFRQILTHYYQGVTIEPY